jgi:SOS response associated peptidase (SRAP)
VAGPLLSFAGLYELWSDPAKEEDDPDRWLWSAAIITHHATWLAGVMNDRTPVMVPPQRIGAWLDPELTDKHAALELITGIEHEPLQVRAVSTAVNKTGRGGSHGPEPIEPAGTAAELVSVALTVAGSSPAGFRGRRGRGCAGHRHLAAAAAALAGSVALATAVTAIMAGVLTLR